MKIADTLRQECMPEMVYSICKLAGNKSYNKDEIKKLITLNSSDLSVFNKAYRFSIDCGFISENPDDKVAINFDSDQIESFRNFRYAVFMDVFKNNSTTFTSVAKWFLSQDKEILNQKSAQDLALALPTDTFGVMEADYILGFRFWMVALGLGMFSRSIRSDVLVFATNKIILDWLKMSEPFKKGITVPAKDFFDRLLTDCPAFETCINSNQVSLSLSMGLRVLHSNNVIELKYTTDSGDIWLLTKSISNPNTNKITEITVR